VVGFGATPQGFNSPHGGFWRFGTCAPQRSNADTAVGSGFCEAKVLVFAIEKGYDNSINCKFKKKYLILWRFNVKIKIYY
jgi:hypothetical protein